MGETVWTEEADMRLRALFDTGDAFSAIAATLTKELGRQVSRNAAIGRAHRLGLSGRKFGGAVLKEMNQARQVQKAKAKANVRRIRVVRAQSSGLQMVDTVEAVDQPPLRVADVVPRMVPLVDLGFGECKYPFGDGPFLFCGCPAIPGQPYCEPHDKLTAGLSMTTYERQSAAQKARWARIGGYKRFSVVAA